MNLSKTVTHKCCGVVEDRAPGEARNSEKVLRVIERNEPLIDNQEEWDESSKEVVWCTSSDSSSVVCLDCGDEVGIRPQESTWCYSVRSCGLMNSYWARLDGPQAAWACRKYNGHRTLPPDALWEARARV